VATSLLGAGMLLHSGVFQRDGRVVRGPELDAEQTGFGPGYRIYKGSDGRWFALVVADRYAWGRLRSLPDVVGLTPTYTPLRRHPDDAVAAEAEQILAAAFAGSPADAWIDRLRALGLLVEPVEELDRDRFRQGILDDPVNRQLGRVAAYETADWGHFEQIGPLLRCGPAPAGRPALILPGIGEHSGEVLSDLGFTPEDIDALFDAKVVGAQ
jgi:crotonobetainyl-CoA:carnitine CoA-transferase CaiB-like acyl-CoA transferase